jgi:hypothetical protein
MMKKNFPSIIAMVIIFFASLVPEFRSKADAAPPLMPPGSNIAPGQQTMVRMVSENVLLAVQKDSTDKYYASISAEFLMQNIGTADESMQVRFPLEDVSGQGDGWGKRPTVRNFSVKVNDQWVSSQEVQEPFQEGGVPISWSAFPVNFPVNQKAHISVYYDTDLGINNRKWTGYSKVDYILETGSGWYGTIGQAVITLRLPFNASETTVLQADSRPVTFVGSETRYIFNDLEPGPDDNIEFLFVNPAVWSQILDLELRTGENPKDVASVIQLADLYLELSAMCPPRGNGFINEHTQSLAETIVAQGLFYSPDSIDLMAEKTKTDYYRYVCGEALNWNSAEVQAIYDKVNYVLSLDPNNPIALEVKQELDFIKDTTALQPSPTEEPQVASPTATIPATTNTPTQQFVPSATAGAANNSSSTWTFAGLGSGTLLLGVLLGILLFLGGTALGAALYKVRRH